MREGRPWNVPFDLAQAVGCFSAAGPIVAAGFGLYAGSMDAAAGDIWLRSNLFSNAFFDLVLLAGVPQRP